MTLTIGVHPPNIQIDPVKCALCNTIHTPDAVAMFTGPENPWWVCDNCARIGAPSWFAAMVQLRAVTGDVTIGAPMSLNESEARGVPFQETCPDCERDIAEPTDIQLARKRTRTEELVSFLESSRWAIIRRVDGLLLCDSCACGHASADLWELLFELRRLEKIDRDNVEPVGGVH